MIIRSVLFIVALLTLGYDIDVRIYITDNMQYAFVAPLRFSLC